MIVIYTQDYTIIRKDADSARKDLINVYGEKLGLEAYVAVKNGRIGTSYRKYGGPLVRIISNREANQIMEKEAAVGMM